mmetsp:Transcript_13687/g.48309  ORF Transcript_13687/g.48309 Transcript_13687/m.48309 type:complete len:311 (+) Transcript_13687:1412-2344(+)
MEKRGFAGLCLPGVRPCAQKGCEGRLDVGSIHLDLCDASPLEEVLREAEEVGRSHIGRPAAGEGAADFELHRPGPAGLPAHGRVPREPRPDVAEEGGPRGGRPGARGHGERRPSAGEGAPGLGAHSARCALPPRGQHYGRLGRARRRWRGDAYHRGLPLQGNKLDGDLAARPLATLDRGRRQIRCSRRQGPGRRRGRGRHDVAGLVRGRRVEALAGRGEGEGRHRRRGSRCLVHPSLGSLGREDEGVFQHAAHQGCVCHQQGPGLSSLVGSCCFRAWWRSLEGVAIAAAASADTRATTAGRRPCSTELDL